MRKGRYKKNFISPEDCPRFRSLFFPALESLTPQNLSAVEYVSAYLLAGLQILRPQNWKGARLKSGEPKTALETFEIFSMRGIPFSANRTLQSWNQGQYQLRLFFHVPSTEEVLLLQSQGIRCVTCIQDFEGLGQYVMNERDPLSFTLHDLIHADHFLHDPEQRKVQIGFSRWMRELWGFSELQLKLQEYPKFASAFEYACADMNSHGAHLVKYLKAIFCQAGCEELLLNLATQSDCSLHFQEALWHLNSEHEKIEHLSWLQEELFLKGSAARQNDENHSVGFRSISAG